MTTRENTQGFVLCLSPNRKTLSTIHDDNISDHLQLLYNMTENFPDDSGSTNVPRITLDHLSGGYTEGDDAAHLYKMVENWKRIANERKVHISEITDWFLYLTGGTRIGPAEDIWNIINENANGFMGKENGMAIFGTVEQFNVTLSKIEEYLVDSILEFDPNDVSWKQSFSRLNSYTIKRI